jgi:hypothetical protein
MAALDDGDSTCSDQTAKHMELIIGEERMRKLSHGPDLRSQLTNAKWLQTGDHTRLVGTSALVQATTPEDLSEAMSRSCLHPLVVYYSASTANLSHHVRCLYTAAGMTLLQRCGV